MSETYILYVHDSDYGAASLDIQSLQSILLTKIAKVPVEIKVLNSLKTCAWYSAPTLVTPSGAISGFSNIVDHFRSLNYNIDFGLSSKQCSDSYAYINMVSEKLKPTLEFLQWIEPRNCDEFTHLWYTRALPFPFNFTLTKNRKKMAEDLMESCYPDEDDVEVLKDHMLKCTTYCLSSLSSKLDESPFFYGNSPTLLDIVVYSYITLLLKLPFPSKDIPNLLSMWPNLEKLSKRIDAKYFPDTTFTNKYIKKPEPNKQNDDDVSYGAILILSVSAISLLVTFAMNKGLVRFSNLR